MLKMRVFSLVAGILFSFSALSAPNQEIPYYGRSFYDKIDVGATDEALVKLLNEATSKGHRTLGYDKARDFILAEFYLVNENGHYAVKDVYCEKEFATAGPHKLPDNTKINVEHTWPQSRFTKSFSKEMQKSDLHHLFPTDSEMNSTRGNFPFGEVSQDQKELKCDTVRFGFTSRGKQLTFEPPTAHKGNVARALFYFSVRYNMPIDTEQEAFLKKWHEEDPADPVEIERNEEIFKLQGNRNPFIDYPELVGKISDF